MVGYNIITSKAKNMALKKDACYRKVGAANWGNKSKGK